MPISTLEDLFNDMLRDVYWAEKHLLKVLPKMAKNASSDDLAGALEDHRAETEEQVRRLEQVFEIIDKPARGKKCEAMIGLVSEGDHILDEVEKPDVRDAGIIASCQAVEHYEIARYGTLVAWARVLGYDQAARLLDTTLEEERRADETLSEIADAADLEVESTRKAA